MPDGNLVEIELTRKGTGSVKIDGRSVACTKLEVSASVNGVPQVVLTILPQSLRVRLDGADVQQVEAIIPS